MNSAGGPAHHRLRPERDHSVRTWLLATVIAVGSGMGAFGLGGGLRSLLGW
ncbi:hypothetical protein [Kineococcus sp. SYSU DK018]|uniref:hypothetical protein n=1 Tax=Kineococcus sp. SYSU DK018 TaxID=3383139 RepID=UPI003D7D1DA7